MITPKNSHEMKTNPNLVELIKELKRFSYENKAPIWKDLAKRLEKPARSWSAVNLSKLEEYARDGETVLIPGKLLGNGGLEKKLTIAAFSFSATSKAKLAKSGSKGVNYLELVKLNPTGKGVRIIG